MKIALIGAGSSVGRHLLSQPNEDFVGIYRSERALSQLCDLGVDGKLVRAGDTATLAAAIRGCDSVVTVVNDENPRGALNSLRQALDACIAAGVGQLIHLSSAAIYGRNAHRLRGVDAPGKALSWSSYAAGKQWQETFLKRRRGALPSIVVLRPGLIWGPGMAWFHAPAGEVLRGEAWIAEGDGPCNLVHIRFLEHALRHFAAARPAGLTFCNLYDRQRLSWGEYYQRIAHHLGARDCPIQMVPRGAVPPWVRSARAARYVFPLGLGWSVSPKPLKDMVKAVVRSLPRPQAAGRVALEPLDVPHPGINREVWELKTGRALPPSSPLLEQLQQSFPVSDAEHWAEIEGLRPWMWA